MISKIIVYSCHGTIVRYLLKTTFWETSIQGQLVVVILWQLDWG